MRPLHCRPTRRRPKCSPRPLWTICRQLEQQRPLLKDAFVTKGGFVNLVLHDEWVARQALQMATEGVKPCELPRAQQKDILVDFAAPNMGKKLHVGHLRSSVLGDTICNLLEFRGHRVA